MIIPATMCSANIQCRKHKQWKSWQKNAEQMIAYDIIVVFVFRSSFEVHAECMTNFPYFLLGSGKADDLVWKFLHVLADDFLWVTLWVDCDEYRLNVDRFFACSSLIGEENFVIRWIIEPKCLAEAYRDPWRRPSSFPFRPGKCPGSGWTRSRWCTICPWSRLMSVHSLVDQWAPIDRQFQPSSTVSHVPSIMLRRWIRKMKHSFHVFAFDLFWWILT